MMSPMQKAAALLAACAGLAACGGSATAGSNAAASKSFNYGSPGAPTQTETDSAVSAEGQLGAARDFNKTPDAAKGESFISISDTLAAGFLGKSSLPMMNHQKTMGDLIHRGVSGDDILACAVTTATSVTYTNCTQTDGGTTVTLNGSITVSAGAANWDLMGSVSGSSNGETINATFHYAGTMTVTATTITGTAGTDLHVTVSGQSGNFSAGASTAAILNLTYQSTPSYCITGGTLEVKEVWTERPQGAQANQFVDAGAKITWTGCDTVQVARSQ